MSKLILREPQLGTPPRVLAEKIVKELFRFQIHSHNDGNAIAVVERILQEGISGKGGDSGQWLYWTTWKCRDCGYEWKKLVDVFADDWGQVTRCSCGRWVHASEMIRWGR